MDKRKIEEHIMNEKETIEMTALLIGGTKNKEHSPTSKEGERETKGKPLNHALTSAAERKTKVRQLHLKEIWEK